MPHRPRSLPDGQARRGRRQRERIHRPTGCRRRSLVGPVRPPRTVRRLQLACHRAPLVVHDLRPQDPVGLGCRRAATGGHDGVSGRPHTGVRQAKDLGTVRPRCDRAGGRLQAQCQGGPRPDPSGGHRTRSARTTSDDAETHASVRAHHPPPSSPVGASSPWCSGCSASISSHPVRKGFSARCTPGDAAGRPIAPNAMS